MKFKFGIIVTKKGQTHIGGENDILHFVGYENEVTDRAKMKILKDDLYRELRDDKELCFEEDLEQYQFHICPDGLLEAYNEAFEDIEHDKI